MKNGWLALALLVWMGFTGCQPDNTVEKAFTEVMALHDEVMPQMSTLSGLEMTLQEVVKDSTLTATAQDSIQQCLKQLGEAEEGMWEWMNQFKKPEMDDKNEALRYLEEKKESIKTVGDAMHSSMEAAQKLVDAYKKS